MKNIREIDYVELKVGYALAFSKLPYGRAKGSSFTTDYLNHRCHRLKGFCYACSKFHNGKNGNFSEKRKLLRIIG